MGTDSITQGFRLSPQQQRVWRLMPPGRHQALSSSCSLRLQGGLDHKALVEALRTVVDRHEILRTAFPVLSGMSLPLQEIGTAAPVVLPVIDLRALSPALQDSEAGTVQAALAVQPFDPAGRAPLRCGLLRLADRESELVLALPALCADLRTLDILAAEIFAACTGATPPATEALQLADVAEWQLQLLAGDENAGEVERWRELWRDAGIAERLGEAIPLDEAPEAEAPFAPVSAAIPLSLDVARGVTPDLALAAWQIALWHSAGRPTQQLVGVLHEGRRYEELAGTAGPLARYLPLVLRLDAEMTAGAVVEQTRESLAEADRRLEQLSWDVVAPETPEAFFPVCFQAVPSAPLFTADTLRARLVRREAILDRFALELVCEAASEGSSLRLRFDPRRIRPASAALLGSRLATLLQALVESAESLAAPLRDLEIVGEAELLQLHRLAFGPDSAAPESCLHHRFAAQAALTPERTAVRGAGPDRTFAELDARANRLAHHLRALGAGPEARVALLLERSTEAVMAILAVLKAGAAWVPLDPAQPADRLRFLLEDAGASLLVATRETAQKLAPPPHVGLVLLDGDAEAISSRPSSAPAVTVLPGNLAYVIYTSGSTGNPKGVLVEHRAPLNLLAGLEALALADRSAPLRASLNAPLIFDASVQQLVLLLAGHTLCVIPDTVRTDGAALLAWLGEHEVDLLDCTPSQLRLLLASGLLETPDRVPGIVFCAGEVMDPAMWSALGSARRTSFFNIYGPTECTVDATGQLVTGGIGGGQPAIGRPLAGYEVFLLDSDLRAVPVGAPGELCIGGAGLARGYLGRADTTAERFVPHPFPEIPGQRLYRTGDLARHLPDGSLEFLGRADRQIKIRGYRIEPGEIEAALVQHSWVREAVVLATGGTSASEPPLLAAYLTLGAGAPADLQSLHGEMQRHLASRLPAYMVPAAFVPLAAFPLTPSGKVDVRALPAPGTARLSGGASVPPRNPREATLAAAWAEVLGVDGIGIDENFFAVGGDSIRSLQVQALCREQGILFSVQQLFEHQTIRQLAAALELAPPDDSAGSTPFSLMTPEERQRLPEDVEDAYPLTQLQMGMVFHTELNADSGLYQDRFSFTLRGPLNGPALAAAARKIAARHPILRTSFDLANPGGPLQRVHRSAEIPFAMIDLRSLDPEAREQELDSFLDVEKTRPFDWNRPPLVRIHVHHLEPERWQFTLIEHHSILDGWSVASVLTELFNIYHGVDRELPPPSPAASLREYVSLERQALASPEHRAWWQRLVDGSVPTLLPRIDAPRPFQGPIPHEIVAPEVPEEVGRGLRELARSAAVPLKSVLLAAHLRTLAFVAGTTDVITGISSDGRPEATGADRTLGIFVSMLPFRFRLTAGSSWSELVREVFAAERELIPYRRFPMAETQRLHGGGRLFETAFNFVHFHVYQGLSAAGDLQVEGSRGFELLDFPLTANFSLDPFTGRVGVGLNGHLEVLDHERLRAVSALYARVLAAMAADPHVPFDAVPLLAEPERRQAVVAANEPWPAHVLPLDPGEGGLHRLIEAQALRTPGDVAVVFEGQEMTYGELDARADQLARRLRSAGVAPESRVGLLMERSPELVVALLAALKAGAAFVPLDPSYPRDRLDFMLADADVSALLTGESTLEGGSTAPLDGLDENTPGEAAAYVIYTSGSTGRPKGAINTHRGIRSRLLWMQAAFGLTGEDRVLQKTPASFDVSVWEFFWPLIAGARLVLARPGGHLDPSYLVRAVAQEKITTLHFVPSLLRIFLEEEGLDACTSLRRVICSGEALPPDLVERFYARCPSAELYNLYGPTEAAVDVTAWPCPRGSRLPRVPIGRPVANTRLYVLDSFLQPVLPGSPGELCIGGVQVARGYHRRPDLTAERFIPDPVHAPENGARPGDRLYRTGDLARVLPDGTFEYLGRIDAQVKIHGVRIEPGEIEAALLRHPAVREAAVTVTVDRRGEPRLTAYLVPRDEDGSSLPAAEMRDFLRERLPATMVPSAFVPLGAFPLTPSGKLDRRSLPLPEEPGGQKTWEPPRNATEELLAGIWAEVLDLPLDRVGIHDNFLELGGHSLAGMQLISRVRAVFAVNLALSALFEANTIAALAVRLVAIQTEQADEAALELMLAELEGLSDAEIHSLLETKGRRG